MRLTLKTRKGKRGEPSQKQQRSNRGGRDRNLSEPPMLAIKYPKFYSGESSIKNKPNVTHNNIITANNVIINYSGRGSAAPNDDSQNQPSQSAMPAGVKRSNTGGELTLDSANDPGTAQIGTPSNNAFPNPFPANTTITNESQSAIESTGNNDEEVMFIGRKVQNNKKNNPYFQPRHSSMLEHQMNNNYQTIKVKQRTSVQQPSFNVKNMNLAS